MIIELGMVNVKGISRDFELGPVTMVSGPNYAGKTAIAQAIRIGLLGYDPKLGKTAGATYGLASGDRMQIALALSNGTRIQRGWQVKRGKLASDGDKEPLTEPMLLDIEQYFGLSRQARVDYVMSLAAEGGIQAKEINAAMHKVRGTIDEQGKPEGLEQWNKMGRQVAELLEAMEQEGASPMDVLDGLIVDWSEAAKLTKGVIMQMTGAGQAAEQLAEGGIIFSDQSAAIETKLRAIDLLSKSYGAMSERGAKRRKLEAELKSAEADAVIGQNTEHLEELRENLKALKATQDQNAKELAKATAAGLQKAVQQANDDLAQANNHKVDREGAVKCFERQVKEVAERLRELCNQDSVKHCAHCGASREHWTQAAQLELKQKIKDTIAEGDKAQRSLEAEKAILAENISVLVAECQEKVQKASKALSDWYELRDSQAYVSTQIANVEAQLTKAAHAGNKVEALKAELEASGPETADQLLQKIKEISASIDAAKGELAALQAAQSQYARQCQQRLHLEQASQERAKQEQILEVLNSGTDAMKELKQVAARKQLMGFVDTINKFTRGILKEGVACDDGEIGYWNGSRWVSHETMSGTEQALIYMGLGVALAAKSKFKIVVMDEMGILDKENEIKVLSRMVELQEGGVINQFIGMTSRRIPAMAGVEHIDL